MSATSAAVSSGSVTHDAVYKRVIFRLIPLIFACYIFNYLDRVNVGFAKLQMLDELSMSETAYGLGAGIFFLGYVTFGVPSNLMLSRIGARRWISCLMLITGILSASMLFVHNETSFYILRFLIGAAEAGFFPGIVFYLSKWFPSARRGRVMAIFMSAIPLSGVIGGPLSGLILSHFAAGHGGLSGWQWLFLVQGVPTAFLGMVVYFVLSDDIDRAKWLTTEEKSILKQEMVEDEKSRPRTVADSFAAVLRNPGVWILGLIYFSIQSGVYSINFWLPSIIRASGFASTNMVGWLSALPYLFAGIFMIIVGRSADAKRERRWHLVVPMLMGVGGLLVAANFSSNPTIALVGLTLATMGALTGLPMFWPLSGGYLSPAAAAGGLALINSIGQVAGFVSPYIVGWIKDTTGSTDVALYILAGVILSGAALVLRVPAERVNR
ncbi:MFS transporter [Agrobacterium salinitolerans]|uniref:MFS transporter n=1 Tax=Agrobacterium salinitolerans TaxID=1183413 RepID=UPI0015720C72|nr:MFS transporter [Agrobacterium salinitolerans]NTA40389.1 MFS transporter [Agrobacterium salinitolerans]